MHRRLSDGSPLHSRLPVNTGEVCDGALVPPGGTGLRSHGLSLSRCSFLPGDAGDNVSRPDHCLSSSPGDHLPFNPLRPGWKLPAFG